MQELWQWPPNEWFSWRTIPWEGAHPWGPGHRGRIPQRPRTEPNMNGKEPWIFLRCKYFIDYFRISCNAFLSYSSLTLPLSSSQIHCYIRCQFSCLKKKTNNNLLAPICTFHILLGVGPANGSRATSLKKTAPPQKPWVGSRSMWLYPGSQFYSLDEVSVFVPAPCSYYYYGSVVLLEVKYRDTSNHVSIVSGCSGYPGSFLLPYVFSDCLFNYWNFGGDCFESIACFW